MVVCSFIGFQVGWMPPPIRIASAAALSNDLPEAVTHPWPQAASGGCVAIVIGLLGLFCWLASISAGVRGGARTGVFPSIAKVLPLLLFV
jgi:hypothetical protein